MAYLPQPLVPEQVSDSGDLFLVVGEDTYLLLIQSLARQQLHLQTVI